MDYKKIVKAKSYQESYNDSVGKINKKLMSIKDQVVTETDIKKLVYKQQPKALFEKIRMGVAYYSFNILIENSGRIGYGFEVPVSDMGDADFSRDMEAKLLLRWLKPTPLYFVNIKEEL